MRKYIIGGLVTAALMFSVTAFADETSIVGKVIQGEYSVKVIKIANPAGETLSTKSIAVDGTTYVPLRVAADTFGYNADFQNKMVILTERSVEPVTTSAPTETPIPETPVDTTEGIKAQIKQLETKQSDIISQMMSIKMKQVNVPLSEEDTKKYNDLEAEGKAIMEKIENLKKQL
jgi:hypothetical protein